MTFLDVAKQKKMPIFYQSRQGFRSKNRSSDFHSGGNCPKRTAGWWSIHVFKSRQKQSPFLLTFEVKRMFFCGIPANYGNCPFSQPASAWTTRKNVRACTIHWFYHGPGRIFRVYEMDTIFCLPHSFPVDQKLHQRKAFIWGPNGSTNLAFEMYCACTLRRYLQGWYLFHTKLSFFGPRKFPSAEGWITFLFLLFRVPEMASIRLCELAKIRTLTSTL